MASERCEACGRTRAQMNETLFDYCAECSADLCRDCMANGHCGFKPAHSGMKADYGEDAEQ